MDSRLNLEVLESRHLELRRNAEAARRRRDWPDDGLPARTDGHRRKTALHPAAVMASLLTWR